MMLNNIQMVAIADIGTKYKGFAKQKYIFDLLAYIAEDEYEDEFIVIKNKQFFLKGTDEDILLSNKYETPILGFTDKIILPKNYLANIKGELTTTIGRLIMNYILLTRNFGSKALYLNEEFNIATIEKKYITELLTDDPNELDKISIKEYIRFMDSVTFIEGFSKVLSVAGTEKSTVPAAGIEEYKKKVMKEIKDKYNITGKIKDPKIISEIETKLNAYEDEWLKGDVSNGRFIYSKTKLARKKMFLDIGVTNTFNGKEDGVTSSLLDGYGTDPETLTTLFNDARSGSYYRGNGTRDGGVAAKVLLRATSDISVIDDDCGSKEGLAITVTDKTIGRYIVQGNSLVLVTSDNISKYLGKSAVMRSPMFCKLDRNFCLKCVGIGMKGHEKGISLLSIDVAGAMLKNALKKFHSSELQLVNADVIGELS